MTLKDGSAEARLLIEMKSRNLATLKFYYLSLLLCFVFALTCSAQVEDISSYMASPSASELGSYGEVPLGMYTGTPQVNVPLYELKTRNLTLPISLNYRSSGFVVDKVSSNVGFDWSLFAGGVITRVLKGLPDEHQNYHRLDYPIDPEKSLGDLTEQEKADVTNYFYMSWDNQSDTQPDLYSFNFAGYSGEFYIDDSGAAIPVPYQKLKIEGPNPFFTITTPDGVVYEFKATEIVGGFTTMTYHLAKITHPAGDEILFYYRPAGSYWYKSGITDNVYNFQWYAVPQIEDRGPCSTNVVPGYPYPKAHRSQVVSVVVLDSIVAPGYAKIVFDTDNNRLDVPELRVKGLKVFDAAGNKVRVVELSHQFPYTTLYSNNVATFENDSYNGDNVYYRMFLDAVVIKDSHETDVLRYSFEYKDLEDLPIRLSYSQDHWGYFNGAYNQSLLPDGIPATIKNTWFAGLSTNADRNPHEEYVQKGMLTRMSYPTGGYTTFEYESNRDYQEEIHGGVRLLEQRNYDINDHQTSVKRYSYFNGVASSGASVSYYRNYSFVTYCWDFITDPIFPPRVAHYYSVYWLSSTPVEVPSPVVYGKVIVNYDDDNQYGREEHEFETMQDMRGTQLYGEYTPTAVEMTNYGWKSGQKTKDRYYSADHLLKSIDYHYYDDPRLDLTRSYVTVQEVLPGADGKDFYASIGNFFNVIRYSIISKWNYLQSKTITDYDENGANPVTTTITYNYDNEEYTQLTGEVLTSSSGEVHEKKMYYPQDYSRVGSLGTLTDKFMINKVIDERNYVGDRLVSGTQTNYNDFGQAVDSYVAEVSQAVQDIAFDANNPYTFTHRISYEYDADKLLKSSHTDEGVNTSYIWSYRKTSPVAKVENANFADIGVATADLAPDFLGGLGNAIDQGDVDGRLAQLRTEIQTDLPNARISTFTYYPTIGLRSSSDYNGRTTFFEYDRFGRLAFVKDNDLNVVKSYVYHYISPSSLPMLEVSPGSFGSNYASAARSFEIKSHGAWSVSADQNWIHVSPSSGNRDGTITVTIDENPLFEQRAGAVAIQDLSGHHLAERKISVTQQAHPNYVGISVSGLTFDHSAQSKSFSITSGVSWNISSSESWLVISPSSGNGNSSITVSPTENTSFAFRRAILTVHDASGNNSPDQFIDILQQGVPSYLVTNSEEMHFERAGGNQTLQVSSNVPWSAGDNQSWLSVTPTSGNGDGTITVTTTANTGTSSRTGTVTINDQSGGGKTQQVSVIQPGTAHYVTLSPTSFLFGAGDMEGEFDIFSDLSSWSTRIIYISGTGWLDEIYPSSGFFNRAGVDVHVNQLPPAGQTWQAEIEVYNSSQGISTKISVYLTN